MMGALALFSYVAFGSWSLAQILIAIIIVAGCVAVTWIVLRNLGIGIPGWVVQIFWVCVLVFVAILAIKFLMSL